MTSNCEFFLIMKKDASLQVLKLETAKKSGIFSSDTR